MADVPDCINHIGTRSIGTIARCGRVENVCQTCATRAGNHTFEPHGMRCPECGSRNVTCDSTRKSHTHRCLDCHYETIAAAVRR